MQSAALRTQVESALGGRVLSPFTFLEGFITETVPSGLPEIDSLTGGLPRGGLTEIFGPDSSGRSSLLLSVLAEMTAREEVCAFVDVNDALNPQSGTAAGVVLNQLLWVRCSDLEQALKATDLLLQGGGFGLVAVDLADVSPQTGRRVPLSSWFRFRRVVENTPTVLVVLEQEPYAKTCASLVLRLEPNRVYWSAAVESVGAGLGARGSGFGVRSLGSLTPNHESRIPILKPAPTANQVPHSYLLRGSRLNVEVVRSRLLERLAGSINPSFEIRTAWAG